MTIPDARARRFQDLESDELRLLLLDAVHRSEEELILAQRRELGLAGVQDARWVDDAAQARFQRSKLAALLCRVVGEA
ncbi:MAG: hypothetical protein HS111_10105 [Kofleriaceae bacterium]|nr:hypothetical protein [Kofleriaceae bacterium]